MCKEASGASLMSRLAKADPAKIDRIRKSLTKAVERRVILAKKKPLAQQFSDKKWNSARKALNEVTRMNLTR